MLYRSNAQSRVLEEALLRAGVPYRIYGGLRFYDRLEIKNVLAYMRLIVNRQDDTAFERVINTPARGIGAKTLEMVRKLAREKEISLWQSAQEIVTQGLLPPRAAKALQGFFELVERLDSETDGLVLHELTDHVLELSGLLAYHKKEKGEKGVARLENLEELVSASRQFEYDEEEETSPLQQFLDQAALDAGDTQTDEFEDGVQLMTLHSAKGLEFNVVFLAGVEENLFPHKMSLQEPGRLEEERRLCYVGITRAKQKLYLSYAESRRLHGKESYNRPSRFVKEIPPALIQEVRLKTTISRPVSASSYAGVQQESIDDFGSGGLSLGQRVMHTLFGEGVIINVEGQGPSARVQVNFDAEGSKWLVLQYAKLEAM